LIKQVSPSTQTKRRGCVRRKHLSALKLRKNRQQSLPLLCKLKRCKAQTQGMHLPGISRLQTIKRAECGVTVPVLNRAISCQ